MTDADGEVRELTETDFNLMRPAGEVFAELFGAEQSAEMLKPKVWRPRKGSPKVFAGIRLDAEVLEAFRAIGKGWQTRMNDALKERLKDHSP